MLDTRHQRFINPIAGRSFGVLDCSTAEVFCLHSSEFALTIPSDCEERLGFLLRGGDEDDRVVTSYMRGSHLDVDRVYLVASARHPNYAFLANMDGVTGLVFHPGGDVSELATSDLLTRADAGEEMTLFAFSELVSASRLGACRKATPPL